MCLEITVCVVLGYQERIVLVADPLSSYEGLLNKIIMIVYSLHAQLNKSKPKDVIDLKLNENLSYLAF